MIRTAYQTQPAGAATIDAGTWAQRKHQLRCEFAALQREADEAVVLQSFERARRQVLTEMPRKMRDLAARGYRYTDAINAQIAALTSQIEAADGTIRRTVRSRCQELAWRIDGIRRAIADLDRARARDPHHLFRIGQEIAGARAEIANIRSWISGQLGTLPDGIAEVEAHIPWAMQTLRLGRDPGQVLASA